MSRPSAPAVARDRVSDAAGTQRLARGITATWWYTVTGIVFFELMLLLIWTGALFLADLGPTAALAVAIGGLLWCASTILLLRDYRHRADAGPGVRWRQLLPPLLLAVVFGAVAGALSGSWLLAAVPVAQSLVLLDWPRGVRLRVVIGLSVVLVCLAVIDTHGGFAASVGPGDGGLPMFVSVLLPGTTVLSLWWWDVLIALDRARVSEARLAATQERLRVATDVHDLQGHHLQVIALQLELAERLMPRDPEAGIDQLRAARRSVDEARQGTRDLATRFRSVPLGDELANARDLLRAAGLEVEAAIGPDADEAPASALGPVIRETTTNVLRHGGGRRARLALARMPGAWRYEIVNDLAPGDARERSDGAGRDGAGLEDSAVGGSGLGGSGLEGIGRRISEAGGTLDVRRGDGEFSVVVTVPAGAGAAAGAAAGTIAGSGADDPGPVPRPTEDAG